MTVLTCAAGALSAGLLGYLVFALLFPEKLS
jgi:K+-transporting ATPase KdpF subunit